jgi:phosphatidylinositol dimannoside acyltransferase
LSGVKDWLVKTGYRLGWKVICRLPESWARSAFSAVTDIAWRRQGHGVQVLEGNLLRVLGPGTSGKELRAASRAAMQSYGRYWLEVFRLPTFGKDRVGRMTVNDQALRALAEVKGGRGVIFALPHMGNWEVAGAWCVSQGVPLTTVAERLKPEAVFDMFVAFRESLGMEVLPLTGGHNAFGVLAQRLRAGRLVCLLCDRDLTESGVEVDFFGEKARMAAGPAALAVQTGASLRAVSLWFTDDAWSAEVSEEIPVPAEGDRRAKTAVMTQELARAFEKGITEHPHDWHMLQRVFTTDLDPARLASPAAEAGTGAGAGGNGTRDRGPGAGL